jgi:urea ABC transporter permease protein UrtC
MSTRAIGIALLALFALLPAVLPGWALSDFAIYFTYAIFAASLAFLWGHSGLLSLGHAVYFGLGAYAMSVVTLGMTPLPASSLLGLAAALAAPGIAACALGVFFFASKGLKGAFFGIVTLALAFIFERIAINSAWLGGMNGLMNIPPVALGRYELLDPLVLYFALLAALAGTIALLEAVIASRFGLALAAIRENELRAWTLGHDVRKLKVAAFTISGMIAGFAGALFVSQFGFASPSLIGFGLSAEVLIWVALGGRGHLAAAALGAIAVRYLEAQLSGDLGAWWPLIAGALFMLSVIVLPRGLFGEAFARLSAIRPRP